MSLYNLSPPPPLDDPVLVMALAGWGDAASTASDAADWIAESGDPIVSFDPDSIFDYRSNRPILRFSSGKLSSLTWPRMEIVHVRPSGKDVLVLVGNEPDFAWAAISDALADLVGVFGVSHLVTLGAVPAPVRHASTTATFCYVGRPYEPAIYSLLMKAAAQIGIDFDLSSIELEATNQVVKLDEILEQRGDAREFVEGLDLSVGTTSLVPENLPTADEIADEVAEFLRDSDDEG